VCDRGTGGLQDHYRIGEKLGFGAYGSVRRVTSRRSGKGCAVKCMSTEAAYSCGMQREAEMLASLDHPNIIALVEGFEDVERTFLVMELCEGGELLDRVIETQSLTEKQAASAMQQVFSAVSFMHGKFICHRDLKAENVMLLTKGPIEQNTMKIVDFGLACRFQPGVPLTERVGTVQYVAPEVMKKNYNESCDLWSCGCMLYLLLRGRLPFNGDTDAEVQKKAARGQFSMVGRKWETISSDAKALLSKLLSTKPQQRCSAEQAVEHDWVRRLSPVPFETTSVQGAHLAFSRRAAPLTHEEPREVAMRPRSPLPGSVLEKVYPMEEEGHSPAESSQCETRFTADSLDTLN